MYILFFCEFWLSAKLPFDLMLSFHRNDEIHSIDGAGCPDRIRLMQEGQSGYSRLPCGWEKEGLSLVSDCLLNALLERVYAAFLPHYKVCYLNARGVQRTVYEYYYSHLFHFLLLCYKYSEAKK
jgi:hypothetical protein